MVSTIITALPDELIHRIVDALPRAADWRALAACNHALQLTALAAEPWRAFIFKEFPVLVAPRVRALRRLDENASVSWRSVYMTLHDVDRICRVTEVVRLNKDVTILRGRTSHPRSVVRSVGRTLGEEARERLADLCLRALVLRLPPQRTSAVRFRSASAHPSCSQPPPRYRPMKTAATRSKSSRGR